MGKTTSDKLVREMFSEEVTSRPRKMREDIAFPKETENVNSLSNRVKLILFGNSSKQSLVGMGGAEK